MGRSCFRLCLDHSGNILLTVIDFAKGGFFAIGSEGPAFFEAHRLIHLEGERIHPNGEHLGVLTCDNEQR
jgi:hypothetical protein